MPLPRPRLLAALALCAVPACVDRSVSEVAPSPVATDNLDFDAKPNPDLDLLFVIDNSNSMKDEQTSLAANFSRMIDVLETLPSGLPSIHIGVVATDVGAGTTACRMPSPGPGVLRNKPMIAGCSPPTDAFISDVDDGHGGRTRNYAGSLSDTFSCIASLGIGGCGFEQPLEAIRRALDPANTANAGFLRDGSLLAIVILSDEDDCSSTDSGFFDATAPAGINGDFRCFARGADCEGIPPETAGTRTSCTPVDDGPLVPVSKYAALLREVRPLDSHMLVAGILGKHDPIRVGINPAGEVDTLTSCSPTASNQDGAYSPIRTDAFLGLMKHSIRESICDADLSPAIVSIGQEISSLLLGGCIDGTLTTPDHPDCSVEAVTHADTPQETSAILPACNQDDGVSATNKPCWIVATDPLCTKGDHQRIVPFFPPGADDDTVLRAQCEVNATPE